MGDIRALIANTAEDESDELIVSRDNERDHVPNEERV
jgi:hypothetical protein